MDYSTLTLGQLLSSDDITIKRNATSILKVCQKCDHNYAFDTGICMYCFAHGPFCARCGGEQYDDGSHDCTYVNGAHKKLRVWDNGGETADRYTVTHPDWNVGDYITMSAEPYSPQGIYLHGNGLDETDNTALGRRIRFSTLPADCQKALLAEVGEKPLEDIPF